VTTLNDSQVGGGVAVVATAEAANGTRATSQLASASGSSGVQDCLSGCTACVAVKSVHLLCKWGCRQTSKYLHQVHLNLVGPMPVKSAGVD